MSSFQEGWRENGGEPEHIDGLLPRYNLNRQLFEGISAGFGFEYFTLRRDRDCPNCFYLEMVMHKRGKIYWFNEKELVQPFAQLVQHIIRVFQAAKTQIEKDRGV